LRELAAQIEQLPASPESEWMLREVRARLVDVDTGVTPRAMRPADPAPTVPAPKAVASTRADRPAPAGRKSVHAAPPAVGLSAAEDREWLLLVATNEVLSLDDSAQISPSGEPRAAQDRRPWTRGLRG
jgi:hypothetical protein